MPQRDVDADGVLAGVRSMIDSRVADPDRIYGYGFSYGGYLINRILTRPRQHPFKGVASWEGPVDPRIVTGVNQEIQLRWRGCEPEKDPELWAGAAPVERAAIVGVPVTVICGGVSAARNQSIAWRDALVGHSKVVDFHEFPGEDHVFSESAHQKALDILAANWLDG